MRSQGNGSSTGPAHDAGFTLIEVIVVIGIMSVLATIASPLFVKQLQRQRIAKTEDRLQIIGDALADYYFDNEQFPATISDSAFVTGYLPGVVGGEVARDPMVRYQLDYGYILTGSNGQCTVYSRGENGNDESGGGDDITIVVSSAPAGNRRTRARLGLIAVALERYLAADPGHQLTGDWLGVDRAALGLGSEFDRDAWGTAFQSVSGQAMVRSAGPDLTFSTGDDLTL